MASSRSSRSRSRSQLASVLVVTLLAFAFFQPSRAAGIAIYWGVNTDEAEGTMAAACATGNYQILIISFLDTFGNGQTPVLNIADHCGPDSNCSRLSSDVRACQSGGVKVLLSLGGETGSYSLSSSDNAREVADYLWNNYLGGTSASRPLGDAILDGIDFDMERPSEYWDDLVRAVAAYRSQRTVYLSAAPGCDFPNGNGNLDAAIQTGLLDYVWPQFYGDSGCQYGPNADALLARWSQWTQVNANQLFLGLPAGPAAASSGYIPRDILTSQILPSIKNSPKYGGVMLWNRFVDRTNGYSSAILSSV